MSPKTETIEIYAPEHYPQCKNCSIANELVGRVFYKLIHDPTYAATHPENRLTCPAKDHPVCPANKTPPVGLH